jgi:hypothetical protein
MSRLVVSLIACSAIALIGAAKWREESVGRAIFIAVAGDILIPVGICVVFFAAMGPGTGCLE